MPIVNDRPDPDLVRQDVADDHERRAIFSAYRLAGMGVLVNVDGVTHNNISRHVLLDLVNDMTGRLPCEHFPQPKAK